MIAKCELPSLPWIYLLHTLRLSFGDRFWPQKCSATLKYLSQQPDTALHVRFYCCRKLTLPHPAWYWLSPPYFANKGTFTRGRSVEQRKRSTYATLALSLFSKPWPCFHIVWPEHTVNGVIFNSVSLRVATMVDLKRVCFPTQLLSQAKLLCLRWISELNVGRKALRSHLLNASAHCSILFFM